MKDKRGEEEKEKRQVGGGEREEWKDLRGG